MADRIDEDRIMQSSKSENECEIPQALLETVFEELPLESVVGVSNPSSLGMDRIIIGIALNTITLSFLALNYILPAIGSVLLFLGFRNFHRENTWFKAAYICSILRLITLIPQLILNATVYSDYLQGGIEMPLTYISCGIQIAMLFSFWRAADKVQEKAGLDEKSFSAGALFIWYIVGFAAGTAGLVGTFGAIVMIIAFIMIIKNLVSLSRLMETNGYVITTSPVKIDDSMLKKGIFGLLALGIAIGYIFFSSYNMKWEAVELPANTTDESYKNLISLGYPKEQLNDLAIEELELLKNADCIVIEREKRPLNDGIEKVEHEGGGTQISTEYPTEELELTHIAVRITGDGSNGELWRIIHHFSLDDELKVKGTASLQLWPTESSNDGWNETNDLSGRILCKKDGKQLAADYHFIGDRSYLSTDFFGTERNATDCICDFSMPKKATERRGYAAYTSKQVVNGYLLNSWVNYIHQTGYFQYPVKSAGQYAKEGMHIRDYPFIMAQAALQVGIIDGKPDIDDMEEYQSDY